MVETFVGDEVRIMTCTSPLENAKAYVDGFTEGRVKVVARGRIGYYLPKNLVFVKRGMRDGTVPVEPYRRNVVAEVPGVISVGGDDDSVEVKSENVAEGTAEFVKFLEEVSVSANKMATTSMKFAVLMESGKQRFSNGWVLSGDLEEVKRTASIELEKRMDGFKEFVVEEMKSVYTKKGKKEK